MAQERQLLHTCETSEDEDAVADAGNDLVELRLLLNRLREAAVAQFGQRVLELQSSALVAPGSLLDSDHISGAGRRREAQTLARAGDLDACVDCATDGSLRQLNATFAGGQRPDLR